MAGPETHDIVVVGGGVTGLTIGFELARRGLAVVVLERDADVGSGASSGNAGYIVPSHAMPLAAPGSIHDGLRWMFRRDAPLQIRLRPALAPWLARFIGASTPRRAARGTALLRALATESLELHRSLADELGTSFRASGILNLYETEAGFAAGRAEARQHAAAGLRVEIRAAQETAELESALVGEITGSVFYPDEGFCDPRQFCGAIAAAASALGAQIETNVAALSLETHRNRVASVLTSRGRITARRFVLAAGVWTAQLLRSAGLQLPLAAGTGYYVEIENDATQPRLPVFLQEAHVTTTPLSQAMRLTGGLDLGRTDASAVRSRTEPLLAAARRVFAQQATSNIARTWHGPRPCMPDGLPAIGPMGYFDNLLVSTGHAMLGVTLAPVSATLLADVLDGKRTPATGAVDPRRFRRQRTLMIAHRPKLDQPAGR